MFTLKFYDQNFSELQSTRNGSVDIDRKQAIRNKIQILKNEYDETTDPFADSFYKLKAEPIDLKQQKIFGNEESSDEETKKIEDEIKMLNKKMVEKILSIPEDRYQIKSDFINLKSEIHESLGNLVIQAEKIASDASKPKDFIKKPKKSEEEDELPLISITNVTPRGKNDKSSEKTKIENLKENYNNQEKSENNEKDNNNIYDFRKLNELRWGVNKNNIIEVVQLPKEIDLIFQLKSENNVSILKSIPINFGEKKKIQMMIDDMKSFISYEDEIQTSSLVYDPEDEGMKELCSDLKFPIYLHLSSLSRELISSRKNIEDDLKYDQKVFDFLNEKDYIISPDKINSEILLNVISGRISERVLNKIIMGQGFYRLIDDSIDESRHSFSKVSSITNNNEKEKADSLKIKSNLKGKSAISTELIKTLQKKSSSSQKFPSLVSKPALAFVSKNLREIYDEIGYPPDQLQNDVIDLNNVVIANYQSWHDSPEFPPEETTENQKEQKKKLIFGDNKCKTQGVQFDGEKKENSSDDDDDESDNDDRGGRTRKSVDLILTEIEELKEAKKNSLNMVDTQIMMKLIAEINNKIEKRLALLLNLILEPDNGNTAKIESSKKTETEENGASFISKSPNVSVSANPFEDCNIIEDEAELKRLKNREKMKTDLRVNLKNVVKDIDKLQPKYIDGHLKTKLLLQFLKEYRKLQEEKQIKEQADSNMDMNKSGSVENPFSKNLMENSVKNMNDRIKRAESKHYYAKKMKTYVPDKEEKFKRTDQKKGTNKYFK